MSDSPSRILSAVEAARRIYDTPQPSEEQVGRVVEKIRSGVLKRSERGGWTTTIGAVADYLARNETAKAATRHHQDHRHEPSPQPSSEPVSDLYQSLLKDYFLAVLLRRKASHRSTAFQQVVIASQLVILGLSLFTIVMFTTYALKKPLVPPQHRIVEAWLDQHFEDVDLQRVQAVDDAKNIFSADFSYRVNKRRIDSHLKFTLRGDLVVDVNSAD